MVQIHTHSPAIVPTVAETCLGAWQRATLRGDRALERGDHSAAMKQYQVALSLADTFPGRSDDADAALAALVVSHHNLVELHERATETELAATHVCRAHELLHEIALDPSMPTCWRDAAWQHGRVTYAALQHFLRVNPDHRRARHAADLVWRDATASQH